jgi:hypothetical protein
MHAVLPWVNVFELEWGGCHLLTFVSPMVGVSRLRVVSTNRTGVVSAVVHPFVERGAKVY